MTTRPRRTKKPKVCPDCSGEGQIATFEIYGRGRNAYRVDTWALCLTCSGGGESQ